MKTQPSDGAFSGAETTQSPRGPGRGPGRSVHSEGGSRTPQRADHVGCSTAWRRPARPRVTARGAGRARAPTGRAHAQGGAPPLPRGEGVYGEAAAAAAQADAEAVAMAPFPDEVDVFTAPHWRMKQLVGRYCDKVTERGAEGGAEERTGSGRPGLRASRNPPALAPCERLVSRAAPAPSRRGAGTCPRGARRLPCVLLAGLAFAGVMGALGRPELPPLSLQGLGDPGRPAPGAPGSPPQAASAVARHRSPARPAPSGSLGRFANTVLRLDL